MNIVALERNSAGTDVSVDCWSELGNVTCYRNTVTEEEVRAILAHGYGILNDVEPITNMEKCLFTVDELTGIIQAAARMRPMGITDMEISSFMKKFKDKKFAAKCDREVIRRGCEMLGMEVRDVAQICLEAMKKHADELELGPKGE